VEDIFGQIAGRRRALADVLDGLTPEQWATPSLCGGWAVRDVAGHLTMPFSVRAPALIVKLIRARGSFDRVSDEFARRAGAASTASLVATLRENADSKFTPPGFGPQAPLTDITVHTFDIGVPTGTTPEFPDAVLAEVLEFLMTPKAGRAFQPKGLTTGLRFEASDLGWTRGAGATVTGNAASLVLALTGRRVGLDGLDGDGAELIRQRLS
jgi:uncharacterized protein (TIGR03083 family)